MPGIDDDAREELRLSLQVVPGWQLSEDGWRTVERYLVGVREAVERNDRVSFFRHLQEIDRAAPPRLARLAPDADPGRHGSSTPPEPVLELINSLVHAPEAGASGTTR